MFTITKTYGFEAAHFLPRHKGKCQRLHGHSYRVDVSVSGEELDEGEMLVDFEVLDMVVEPIVEKWDHQSLNDYFDQPTAEVLAQHIGLEVQAKLSRAASVTVWETQKARATYVAE